VRRHDQRLDERLGGRAPRFPDGFEGGVAVRRGRGETSPMHARRRHAHPTPMFPHGCSAAPTICGEPQRGVAVLQKGGAWPAWPREGAQPLDTPVGPRGPPDSRRARPRRALATHPQADWPEPSAAHGPGKRPGRCVLHGHRLRGRARAAGDEGCPSHGVPSPWETLPRGLLQAQAVGLQVPGLVPPAAPGGGPGAGHGPPRCGPRPTGKPPDAPGALVWQRGVPYRAAESDGRPPWVRELRHGWRGHEERRHCLLAASPCLLGRGEGTVRHVWLAQRLPLGARGIAPRHTAGHGQSDGTTASRTRAGMRRARRRRVALLVRASAGGRRAAAGGRRLVQLRTPTGMATLWAPWRFGKDTGEGGLVRPL